MELFRRSNRLRQRRLGPGGPVSAQRQNRLDDEELDSADAQVHVDGRDEADYSRRPPLPGTPLVLCRSEHCISRRNIDPDALKVMRRLIRNGYRAFLVGGGVRDLLLQRRPNDFDISTDASPEEVRTLFRNSRVIGRRFKIIHVYFRGDKIIEVSTFRATSSAEDGENVLLASDNTYGDPETDAVRRDLTVNGMFYDLSTFSVIDYVGGIQDLRDGLIRIIGDPEQRIQEDPVRMIRVLRHAGRTGFLIQEDTYNAVCRQKALLKLCPISRIHEEVMRDLRGGGIKDTFQLLQDTGVLSLLFPLLARMLDAPRPGQREHLQAVLSRLDHRAHAGEEVSTSVIMLALMIGHFPSGHWNDPLLSELRRYWELVPEPYCGEEEETPEETEELLEKVAYRQEKTLRGYQPRRAKITPLGRMIARAFEPIGLPRRDRERMEQLLQARYSLLSAPEGTLSYELWRRLNSPELRDLVQLCGQQELFARHQPAAPESARPRRRRRRNRPHGRR